MNRTRWVVLLVAAAVLTLLVGAGGAVARSVESLSTGVSAAERVAHKDYSLLMMFSKSTGPYLANITVEVKDAKGEVVLATTSTGPWLFAKLPAGDYTVVATRTTGEKTGASFTVGGAKQQVLRLSW